MNWIRVGLLGILIIWRGAMLPGALVAQNLHKSQKRLERILPEFNRAFEENNPAILSTRAYRHDLRILKRSYERYHRNYYGVADSLEKRNNEALLLALSGNFSKAAQQLRNVQASRIGYHRGLIHLLQKDYAAALTDLNDSGVSSHGKLNRMVALGVSGDVAGALRTAAALTDLTGKGAYNEAVLMKKSGAEEAAVEKVSAALLKKKLPVYYLQRGDLLMRLGKPERAVTDFGKLSKKMPAALVRYAHALLSLERYQEAVVLLEKYLDSGNPALRPEARLILGDALYGLQRYQEAQSYYERAARYRPLLEPARTGLANVALSERRYGAAKTLLERILEQDKAPVAAWLGLAVANYGLHRYQEALNCFGKAAEKMDPADPSLADMFVSRGYCHYFTGRQESARQDFETAIRLDAGRYEALAGMSNIAIDNKQFSAAGTYLSKALRYQKEDDKMWSNYGNLLLHFGMFRKSYTVFGNAVRLNPRNLNAQNGWGVSLLERDQLELAKVLFDSLVRTNPSSPFILNNRGIVHAYIGNRYEQHQEKDRADASYERAGGDFNAAMNNAPARQFYHVNKGNVFRYWQQFDDARLSYQSYQDKSALNNTAVMMAGLERMKDARYYMGVALQLDSTHKVFQYNMTVLANGKARELAQLVASSRNSGLYSDIGIKYSLDGYVTIYLYDYEYNTLSFPGRHHMPLPRYEFSGDYLIPEYDFTLLPYSAKDDPVVRQKRLRPTKVKSGGKLRSGTRCPVLF